MQKPSIPRVANAPIRTKYGEFVLHVFSWSENEQDNVLAMVPNIPASYPLIRIQSACYTGEIFESLDCDCHWQLETSLEAISQEGGVFIYMLKDGRGAGLFEKVRGMKLSHDKKIDTADAYQELGIPLDPRTYEYAVFILKHFGYLSVRLLTNNPRKISGLTDAGLKVERVPLESEPTAYNSHYLKAKAMKLGHFMQCFDSNK